MLRRFSKYAKRFWANKLKYAKPKYAIEPPLISRHRFVQVHRSCVVNSLEYLETKPEHFSTTAPKRKG
jgi:hypothetical protein